MKRIAFIGSGNVAIAIVGGVIAKGMGPERINSMPAEGFAVMIYRAMTACGDRSTELEKG